MRDYVHVTDLAQAHVLACQKMDGASGFRAYNLGTGDGVSNIQIIEAARRRTNLKIEVVPGPRRAGDPPVLTADPGRATRELGWRPTLSNAETIIDTAWLWRQHRRATPSREPPERIAP